MPRIAGACYLLQPYISPNGCEPSRTCLIHTRLFGATDQGIILNRANFTSNCFVPACWKVTVALVFSPCPSTCTMCPIPKRSCSMVIPADNPADGCCDDTADGAVSDGTGFRRRPTGATLLSSDGFGKRPEPDMTDAGRLHERECSGLSSKSDDGRGFSGTASSERMSAGSMSRVEPSADTLFTPVAMTGAGEDAMPFGTRDGHIQQPPLFFELPV